MTKQELYKLITNCLGTPRTMADEACYDKLHEELWGITEKCEKPASEPSEKCEKRDESGSEKCENGYKELPFDLELAKEHPDCVYTRNGMKARIICTDSKLVDRPIIALVQEDDDTEIMVSLSLSGYSELDVESDCDLILRKPVKRVKHEGWIGIYRYDDESNIETHCPCVAESGIYDTREEAEEELGEESRAVSLIDIVKIEWFEEE